MYSTRSIVFNAVTFVPGVTAIPGVRDHLARRDKGTGGTISARYCYSVWLRHLVKAAESGLDTRPQVIAELGPGDSLGIGIAALLSGASKCYALDVISHVTAERNIQVLYELAELFSRRADIPDEAEFPIVIPKLKSYRFPEQLITNGAANTSATRIREIESALRGTSQGGAVQLRAPWLDAAVIEDGTIDMLFSQAVLEHVDELSEAYDAMRRWLKPGGFMSHSVDFKSHECAREWNGHWSYSDLKWALVRGKRSWFLNREPLSTHMRLLHKNGFRTICEDAVTRPSALRPQHLARRFKNLAPADLTTSDVFFQAVKQH
ncbi:methyltransferase domain-containing protein [Bradyrhizobium sp. UFLA05-153]